MVGARRLTQRLLAHPQAGALAPHIFLGVFARVLSTVRAAAGADASLRAELRRANVCVGWGVGARTGGWGCGGGDPIQRLRRDPACRSVAWDRQHPPDSKLHTSAQDARQLTVCVCDADPSRYGRLAVSLAPVGAPCHGAAGRAVLEGALASITLLAVTEEDVPEKGRPAAGGGRRLRLLDADLLVLAMGLWPLVDTRMQELHMQSAARLLGPSSKPFAFSRFRTRNTTCYSHRRLLPFSYQEYHML